MSKKILIIEDDEDINELIKDALEKENFLCRQSYSGSEGLLILEYEKEAFDIILLDLMLPGMSGEDLLVEIRKKYDTPVLVLSAKDGIDSKVNLLTSGADDYMVKPFSVDELIARINLLTRDRKSSNEESEILKHKDMELDISAYTCKIKGESLNLTSAEIKILHLLLLNPKRVYSKENIYEYALGDSFYYGDQTINVHISNIRKKIKEYTDQDYIETVWGIGFKLKS